MEEKAEFIKDLSNNYMVLKQREEADSFVIKMLDKNRIEGLLKLEVKTIDNQKYYYYDITSKQAIGDLFAGHAVTYGQLKKIYGSIFRLPDVLKEYLMDENGILLKPEFIYIDASGNKIEFCYYPGQNSDLRNQIVEFTEYLMNKVDYKDKQAVLTIYEIYQISHENSCTLKELRNIFEKQQEDGRGKIPYQNEETEQQGIDKKGEKEDLKKDTEKEERSEKEDGEEKRAGKQWKNQGKEQIEKRGEWPEEESFKKMDSRIKKIDIKRVLQKEEMAKIGKEKVREERMQEKSIQEKNMQKERMQEKSIRERNMQKERMQEESIRERNMQKERMRQESIGEESIQKERMRQENMRERNMKKETMEKEKNKKKEYEYPHMEERVESQREVLKYPLKIYAEAAAAWIGGLLCIGIMLKMGNLSTNGVLDMKKCGAAIAVYILAEAGCFLLLFRKENRCAAMKEEVDYMEWEDEYDQEYDDELPIPDITGFISPEETKENFYQEKFLKEAGSNLSHNGLYDDAKTQRLDEEDETELLVDFQNKSIAYLESEFSGERIYLEKLPFIIGKLKNGADHVLESAKISRIHARFDYDDGCYYIEDMGSTNGTRINGEQLYAHERKAVPDKARISLADINFLFHC